MQRSSISPAWYRGRVRPVNPAGCFLSLLAILLIFPLRSLSQDIWIETQIYMSDGIALDARIVEPLGFPPSGGFPGVILIHGYGGNKDFMQTVQVAIAAYGYASLAYSVRGQGNSGGVSTISGDREREDLLAVIQFFRSTSNINPNKLGVAGGSQGGIHSWMAAVHRMPGVKAVAPLIATPDFAEVLVPNGCVKTGLPREMTVSSVRYSDDRDRVKGFIIADQRDSILAFIKAHDLAHLVGNVQIPVLQALGWGDFLFPVNGGIRAAANLAERRIPVWSFYGTNGHGQPIDPTGAILALDKTVQWFDHWLKGFSLDRDSVPMVFYCDDRQTVSEMSTEQWPPPSASTKRFYFTGNGLSEAPPTNDVPFKSPFMLGYNPAYAPAIGWNDMYGGSAFLQAFPSSPVRFVTAPFGETVQIAGIPTGRIFVGSDGTKFQVHVRLYDVSSDISGGSWTLISRSINGIRENTPGAVHELAIEATAISHFIPPGNRLGVEITSLDMLDDTQANTIPYFAATNSFLLASSVQRSYIQLGDTPATGLEREERVPAGFRLDQNFPNPFNPTTVIRYQLPVASDVRLVVHDLLGREVAVLVEEPNAPGSYRVRFDANGLASGVYLCRLTAGRYGETRKMLLVR
jgi:predicted acyl esterase